MTAVLAGFPMCPVYLPSFTNCAIRLRTAMAVNSDVSYPETLHESQIRSTIALV